MMTIENFKMHQDSFKKNFRRVLYGAMFLTAIMVICSCSNDDGGGIGSTAPTNTSDNFSDNFGSTINRSFLGSVIDKNKNPVENVTITIGSTTAFTDAKGVFKISNASVYERFAYVKAEKAGYMHGSRSVIPSSGVNQVIIMLLEEAVAGTVNSGSQATVSLSDGASVTLNGEYINTDGSPYSGAVNVILHSLDATDEDVLLQMPGMLYAQNSNNEERMLETFGMLAVELRGSGGEDLNIAEGSSAEIRMPLDASLIANAPSTIPLWYFDEDKGYWKEEGEATLVGNEYVGTVTHFSFWNSDIQVEAVNLCITVTNQSNEELADVDVRLTSASIGTKGGTTNGNGRVCGLIPANQTLEANIFRNGCGTAPVFTQNIGPFAADSDIVLQVSDALTDVTVDKITGSFNNCDGNPLSNGYAKIVYDDRSFFVNIDESGNFETNILHCLSNSAFTIEAVDFDTLQTTGALDYNFTSPETNIGTLNTCNGLSEFIQYTIDGTESYIYVDNVASFNLQAMNDLNISASDTNSCFYLYGILNNAPYVGIYDNYDFTNGGVGMSLLECIDNSATNNNIEYNLTALGDIGEYININFSGDYEDRNGNPHTIEGSIHVLRDE